MISILHIFHKSIKSVCSDAMAYAGLFFWITLETQNSVKDPNRWQSQLEMGNKTSKGKME